MANPRASIEGIRPFSRSSFRPARIECDSNTFRNPSSSGERLRALPPLFFCCGGVKEPLPVRLGDVARCDHYELRNLIRMRGEQRIFQLANALFHRLDDQELLVVALDLPLPAIDGVNAWNDVDAGGETPLDEV